MKKVASAAAILLVLTTLYCSNEVAEGFTTTTTTTITTGIAHSKMTGSPTTTGNAHRVKTQLSMSKKQQQQQNNNNYDSNEHLSSRRDAVTAAAASLLLFPATASTAAAAAAAAAGETRQGIPLDAFNSLTFQYKNSNFGGLDASTLNGEPSIPYQEFLEKLDKGDVQYVEFYAPDGDKAYATIRNNNSEGSSSSSGSSGAATTTRIRIGEGYPIEQHDGWSSPAFVVRSVKNKGVPYKFIVPGLDAYK